MAGRGITGLGATRSLASAHIPVLNACDDELVPCSRHYRPALTKTGQPWRLELGATGYELLSELPHSKAVLLPCADDVALWMAQRPVHLQSRFVSSLASTESLAKLQDKRNFHRLCETLEVPHPRSFEINVPEDLVALPFDDPGRLFLKPSNSVRFRTAFGMKGVWLKNRQYAHEWWIRCQEIGLEVLVQEYVEGGADQHFFIDGFRDRHGVVTALLARRRTRMHPADFGDSSYCHHIPVDDIRAAWHSLQSILAYLRYRGIFSAEFKRGTIDGLFRILEINTRAWIYVDFATYCGVNICEMAYRDALELPVQSSVPNRMGTGCVNLNADFFSLCATPRKARPSWTTIGWQWISAYKAVFTIRDPMPALKWFLRRLVLCVQRVCRINRNTNELAKDR